MIKLEELIDFCKHKDNIYLYGNGKFSKKLIYLLNNDYITINGYIVSSPEDANIQKNVFCLYELMKNDIRNINLIVAIKDANYELFNILVDKGFKSILFPTPKLIEDVYNKITKLKIKEYNDSQTEFYFDESYEYKENCMSFLKCKYNSQAIFRIFCCNYNFDYIVQNVSCNSFNQKFGKLKILCHQNSDFEFKSEKNIEIYAATSHLDKTDANSIYTRYHRPIQVGAYFTDLKKCKITDNTGDNISDRNRDYSECTGLYWVWKNTSGQDYVGFEQYRRKLFIDDSSISQMYSENVDVVLALPQVLMKTTKEFFVDTGHHIFEYDWRLIRKFSAEYSSNYERYFDECEKSCIYFSCNLAIMKRSVFDDYCKFAFTVSDKLYQYYRDRNIIREDRYMGYIFEILLSLYMMKNYKSLNVMCTDVIWKDK